jgi:hypothetical protein
MLARVLLHVIESASPIDPALDFMRRKRRAQNVHHAVFFVGDFDNRDATQGPRVKGLTS